MAKKAPSWKKQFTTITPFSKALAFILFILLPVLAFYFGMQYQKSVDWLMPVAPIVLPLHGK